MNAVRRGRIFSVVLFALVAACTQSETSVVASSSVIESPIGGPKTMPVYGETVPWIDEIATPSPVPVIGSNVHPCSADELATSLPGMEGATGGQMAGTLVFRNISNSACTLHGSPVVSLLDATGNSIRVEMFRGSTQFSPIKPRPPTWPDLLLEPRDEARVFVVSSNQCGPQVAEWEVTVPDGTQERIADGWTMGVCLYPHRTASLSVGSFEPPESPPKWPLSPNIVDEHPQAAPGSDLNYVVSLYNVPGRPFTFPTPCPSYEQRIMQSGHVVAKESLTLNCATIGPVPGRTAVNFAMTMHVPALAHGTYSLVWTLDPPYGYDAKVPLTIQ